MIDTALLDRLVLLDETGTLTEENVRELFPGFSESDNAYDKIVNAVFVEEYAFRRNTGLSASKSANMLGHSSSLLSALLSGKGISMGRFVALARAELFSRAHFEGSNLETLHTSATSDSPVAWQAALKSISEVSADKEHTYEHRRLRTPENLSLSVRQELAYRYQYLEDSVSCLANEYFLDESELLRYISEKDLKREEIATEEDVVKFEEIVNSLYNSLRIRMLGITALNTAKSWESLSRSEELLLKGLTNAAAELATQKDPDPKMLASLTDTHNKLISRHALIQQKAADPGGIIAALKDTGGWSIEVTHIDSKPKSLVVESEVEDE